METRIGDRYKNTFYECFVIETVDFVNGEAVQRVVRNDSYFGQYPIGSEGVWNLSSEAWKYIGNFAKSSLFKEIYNILNDDGKEA
jgi:hypothetical protein